MVVIVRVARALVLDNSQRGPIRISNNRLTCIVGCLSFPQNYHAFRSTPRMKKWSLLRINHQKISLAINRVIHYKRLPRMANLSSAQSAACQQTVRPEMSGVRFANIANDLPFPWPDLPWTFGTKSCWTEDVIVLQVRARRR